jgi:hypothetical protein
MKNDIIEQLYFGNIDPSALTFDRDSEFGQAMDDLTNAEEHIRSVLSEADKPVFEKLIKAQHTIDAATAQDAFAKGFRLGAKLMLAVFDDSADALHELIE